MAGTEREISEREAYGLLFLVSLIWAGNFIAAKVALQVVGPITLSALRAVLATGVLLWYVRFTHQTWPSVSAADLRIFVTLALTGLVTNTTIWYYGMHRTLAINAAILGAMGPVFVALLSATWLRERLSRLNLLGILVSSAGVVLTVTRGSLRRSSTSISTRATFSSSSDSASGPSTPSTPARSPAGTRPPSSPPAPTSSRPPS